MSLLLARGMAVPQAVDDALLAAMEYGVSAPIGLAAYYHLRERGLTEGNPRSVDELRRALEARLFVGSRPVHYRFARQRAERIASAQLFFAEHPLAPAEPLALRDWLLQIDGVGMKTASWIVRNRTQSDHIAVLDIHILRACGAIGVLLDLAAEKLCRSCIDRRPKTLQRDEFQG